MEEDTAAGLKDAIRVDQGQLRGHIDEVVRSSVEETLNALLQAEADQICGATRYERSPDRVDTRAGHYERKLETKAGEVRLKVPKLRRLPFETVIIERYRRRESSVEEALVEMYLAGVSVRRVEDITEALWGSRVSSSTISDLNQKIYVQIEAWRLRAEDIRPWKIKVEQLARPLEAVFEVGGRHRGHYWFRLFLSRIVREIGLRRFRTQHLRP